MVRLSWKITVALLLTGLSLLLGTAHYLLFGNLKDLLFYLALDVVFVPVQVLLVTLIIERLLTERERQAKFKKLNMVIGAFFSEAGTCLLKQMDGFADGGGELRNTLAVESAWGRREYALARDFVMKNPPRFVPGPAHLEELRAMLLARRGFILSLLQNPNLLEHDRFTDLLWAVCHLTEELEARADFNLTPESDLNHLVGDINRAFGLLVREWLSYMQHLKEDYPFIYSLAVRTNPFNPQASAIVKAA